MEHHFIGIKASAAISEEAVKLQHELDLQKFYKLLPEPEDLHLTLLFLGGWDRGKKVQLWEQLQKLPTAPFSLTFSRYGFFGNAARPRVLFLRPEESMELQRFYDMIVEEALKLDYPGMKNPFKPHVTIAKKYANEIDFPHPGYGKIPPVTMRVKEAGLFKVKPQQSPRYEMEQKLKLL